MPQTPEFASVSTYYPSTPEAANAVPVDIGPGGEIRGINIRLRQTQVFRVRGKVMNAGGAGRGTVNVMLTPKEGAMNMVASGIARAPEYAFEIRGVSPGTYILHAQMGNNAQPAVAFQEIHIANQHVEGVALAVAEGHDIQGVVKIEDASGPPASAPNLNINLRPSMPLIGAVPRAKVGDDLKFTLKSVPALHYIVRPNGLPEGTYLKSIRFGGQEIPDDGVDMLSGGVMEVILSATAAEVDAAVVDKEGKPVAGAMVALIPKAGPPTAAQTNQTDEMGAVVFKGLKPGDYKLIAFEDIPWGASQDPEFVKPYEGRGETVKLDASAKQAVQLKVIPAEETDK
jgi:hypothetical protein